MQVDYLISLHQFAAILRGRVSPPDFLYIFPVDMSTEILTPLLYSVRPPVHLIFLISRSVSNVA